ncbi:MAG: AI-2E family transporter [Paludibacter sp.]|nr:AI-2E family transporter [Bacteroidales bacterium]MCM1069910.1 AI-2E family transporter [Prevotella sp.]MCM1354673.1 AI-2E family transporter [Bacteroides sp.]MCM1443486.1 AI-2E family transporter [Muribaculum sp.]MCM1482591.1 AI-2E family transporter [Paludibacter sp.]
MEEKPFTLDRTVRLVITVAVLVGLFLITRQLSGVLLPFLVSWFLAYLIHPVVNFFQYKIRLKNRTLSVIVTLLVLLAFLTGAIALLVSPVTQEVTKMTAVISTYLSGINADTILPAAWQESIREWLRTIDVVSFLREGNITALVGKIAPYVGGLLGSGISMVMGLFVVFICFLYLIFILIDYERISTGVVNIVPHKYRSLVADILKDLETGMNRYFRGQALIATCVGILFAIGFSIMRLPLAIIIGLLIGVLNMIPYMQGLGIPVCMLLGLLQSAATGTDYWIILVEIAIVFCVVQAIQDMLLNPLIMGNAIGMKPAVMLLSLSIWGSLLGVAGMIIALPLTTVMISYYKRLVLHEDERITNELTPQDSTLKNSPNKQKN